MTATVPQASRAATPPGGPTAVRRFGVIYGYDVRDVFNPDEATAAARPCDYVGQSRVPELRDRQHRGLTPQRDGQIREQPWADRIEGGQRILEQGEWTDEELDRRELHWMTASASRLNCRDNPNPDRIPIYEQRRLRDARDAAKGLPPRDWFHPASSAAVPQVAAQPVQPVSAPSRPVRLHLPQSRWGRKALAWAALTPVLWLLGVLFVADWQPREGVAVAAVAAGILVNPRRVAGWVAALFRDGGHGRGRARTKQRRRGTARQRVPRRRR